MTKSTRVLFLILIIIIAGFLRLYQLKTVPPGLYPDEAMNGNNALQALRASDFKIFYPENNGREGLFINIQAVFLKFFGAGSPSFDPEPWMLRLPSAIFGILTVLGLYFLAKELFSKNFQFSIYNLQSNLNGQIFNGEKIALLASFFAATSFWHINFSRIGFRAIMAPFLLIWAIYFLLLAIRKLQTEESFLLSTFYFLLSGIVFGLGFYTYIAYRVMPALILMILIYYWLKNKDGQIRKKILLSTFYFLLSTFLVALPIGIYYLEHPADFLGRTGQVSIFNSVTPLKDLGANVLKTAGMFNIRGDGNWRHNYNGRPELFWPVGILFILGLCLGLIIILKIFNLQFSIFPDFIEDPRQSRDNEFSITKFTNKYLDLGNWNFGFVILFSWLLLAMLPVVISNEGIPHALRAMLMIPPVIILSAVGGVWLYEKILTKLRNITKIRKILLFSAFYFLLSLFVFQAYVAYFILWANNPNTAAAFSADYVALGQALNKLPREIPKYVIVEASGVPVDVPDALMGGFKLIPMPAQTIMFITDTYSAEGQKAKNIYYLLPEEGKGLPADTLRFYIK